MTNYGDHDWLVNCGEYLPYKRGLYFDFVEKEEFPAIRHIMTKCTGRILLGYSRPCWPYPSPDSGFRLSFFRLASNYTGEYVPSTAGRYKPTVNGNHLIVDDLLDENEIKLWDGRFTGFDLIFIKPGNGKYIFYGVYISDRQETCSHHYVFKKVATKVRMLGKPVESIKLLDNVEQVSDSETLKLRMEPHRYRKRNGKLYCACPRCGIMQEIAAKCASCGQLM